MSYERDLTRSEQQNEHELSVLRAERDKMTRLERVRKLGVSFDLSNRIARIEGVMRERRRLFDFPHHSEELELPDDSATDTFSVPIEHE